MEKKTAPACEPCEQMFEEKVETMVDEVENYSAADRDERRTEVNDVFGRAEHGGKRTTGSACNSTGNPSRQHEFRNRNEAHDCGRGAYAKEDYAGRENYRKEHEAACGRDDRYREHPAHSEHYKEDRRS